MIPKAKQQHTGPFWEAPDLTKAGFPVFPIGLDKQPSVRGGFYAATTDMSQIAAWIEEGRGDHDIAIPTGLPTLTVVIDADTPEAYAQMVAKYGEPTVKTRRGGHWYFAHPQDGKVTSREFEPGLDCKADGGYVVVPPSRNRSWTSSAAPDLDHLPRLPKELRSALREQPEEPSRSARASCNSEIGAKIANGSRNKQLFSIAGTLRRRGLEEASIAAALLGINGTKCETPLPEAEVQKIAHSVTRYAPEGPIEDDFDHSSNKGEEFDRNKSALPLKTVEELVSESGDGPAWVVENILARGALTDFAGLAKKGGKTTFWLHAITAGARGEDHAGFATDPSKYLYLTEQGGNFADALRDSGLEEHPDHIRIVQFKDVTTVEWERLIRQAGAAAKRMGFDVLAVDTFAVFARMKGTEENDSGAVGDRMRILRLVAQKYNLAVVLIRHAGKDGTPRGSSAFEAEADICVTISRPEGRHDPRVRKLSGVGRYGEWEQNVQLVDGRYLSLGTDDRVEFRKAVRFVKATLPDSPQAGMRKQDLLDRRAGEDITSATLSRALRWLVRQGDVGEKQIMDQRGKPKVYWLAYKPPGGGDKDGDIYFDQTISTYNGNDRNKSERENTRRRLSVVDVAAELRRDQSGPAKALAHYLENPTEPRLEYVVKAVLVARGMETTESNVYSPLVKQAAADPSNHPLSCVCQGCL
jgi:Bifunctional DNA primase/polymerase, N-terminal/AAA domain/Primase C terminal 1 (PriCT-1)